MADEIQHAYLDVHLSTLQEAQSSVACAVRAQGYQLLELLQVEPEFSSSERARDRPSSEAADPTKLCSCVLYKVERGLLGPPQASVLL